MPYKYNPLLKLDLQKQQEVPEPPQITIDDALSDTSENAVQNRVITEEITKISDTQTKKVTKFYESIEELEVGEIGEYQGESNEQFTNGFFYKRGKGSGVQYVENGNVTLLRKVPNLEIYQTISTGTCPFAPFTNSNPAVIYQALIDDLYVDFFVLPVDSKVISPYYVDNDALFSFGSLPCVGYLLPFAYIPMMSARCEIKYEPGNLHFLYNGTWIAVTGFSSWVRPQSSDRINFAYMLYDGHMCSAWFYSPSSVAISVYGLNSNDNIYYCLEGLYHFAYPSINRYVSQWDVVDFETMSYIPTYENDYLFKRVNIQPPYKSQPLSLSTDSAGNVDTGLTLADIVPICAYDTNNDVRLMLSVNNAQHIIITPASYSDATTRYPETSFSCVLFYIEVPTA